jgi:hypothetical protein
VFVSENEARVKADAQNPSPDKSNYIQIGFKTANPEAFAATALQLYKEAIKAISAFVPVVAMALSFWRVSTAFDEERTYVTITSEMVESFTKELVWNGKFLSPTEDSPFTLEATSEGNIGAGFENIVNSDLEVTAKIGAVEQEF